MELSVSNDFISMFIPESSEFSTEEIIDEFKIYVFRMMNITIDSLVQEQINNDFENAELKKKYKDFFINRIDHVIKVTSLFNEISTKTAIIKSSLEKNINIIEKNKNTFDENNINKEIYTVVNDIKINKSMMKNNVNNNFILDFVAIPSNMLKCFINEEFDLYCEYREYVNSIEDNIDRTVDDIKKTVLYIDSELNKMMIDLISCDCAKFNIDYLLLYRMLKLSLNSLYDDDNEETKKLSVIIYKSEEFYNKNKTNDTMSMLSYFAKVIKDINTCTSNKTYRALSISFLYDKFIAALIKSIIEDKSISYNTKKMNVIDFVDNANMNSEEYSNVIADIDTALKKKFFEYIRETMNNNKEVVKDYFIMMKDIKKLYQATIQSANGTVELKYEICYIIYNNLSYINNIVTNDIFLRHKDKVKMIEMMIEHCDEILKIVCEFYNDNMFLFRVNDEIEKEHNMFKDILMNKIIYKFIGDIYNFFQMPNAFDLHCLKNENEFNTLVNKEII